MVKQRTWHMTWISSWFWFLADWRRWHGAETSVTHSSEKDQVTVLFYVTGLHTTGLYGRGLIASRLLAWRPVSISSPFSMSQISSWCRVDGFAAVWLDCYLVVRLCRKWLSPFCRSNIRPDYADSNFHDFKMHTFTRVTSCRVCQMLLR